jgi:hypothetical protein
MAKDIKVSEVVAVDGKAVVRGTFGETSFEASQLQWGGKVLMKVVGGDFDRGTRISIGHAAKKAVRAAGLDLTPAPLKRPRKAKGSEPVAEAVSESEPVTLDEVTFEAVV